MEQLFNYITSPDTIISLVIFMFTLWWAWSTINSKQKDLERRIEKIEELDLDSRLTRMETTLEYIRTSLEKLEKLHN
jgi:Co/Zn/Cd efflux system component